MGLSNYLKTTLMKKTSFKFPDYFMEEVVPKPPLAGDGDGIGNASAHPVPPPPPEPPPKTAKVGNEPFDNHEK